MVGFRSSTTSFLPNGETFFPGSFYPVLPSKQWKYFLPARAYPRLSTMLCWHQKNVCSMKFLNTCL